MSLTCPKCHGAMRSYERNGVTVDQCTECRGVFLDRGELEHLVDAENRWNAGAQPGRPGAAPPHSPGFGAGSPGHPGAGGGGAGHPAAGGGGPAGQGASGGGLGAVVGEVLRQAGSARSGHSGSSGGSYGSSYGSQPKRKKSFLDELFG